MNGEICDQSICYSIDIQAQSLTVTPLTATVGQSDTLNVSQTITNEFKAVRMTNLRLQ